MSEQPTMTSRLLPNTENLSQDFTHEDMVHGGMTGATAELWAVRFTLPAAAADFFSDALLDEAYSVTTREVEGNPGLWQMELHVQGKPDASHWQKRLHHLATAAQVSIGEAEYEAVEIRDWIGELQQTFPPFAVGRFFIHGSHYKGDKPADQYHLLVDAGMAFGSGEHATTEGCLYYLNQLREEVTPRRMLDVGTGSGILAMAMARQWWQVGMPPVVASDIDEPSVRVAQDNAQINGLAEALEVVKADGYRHAAIREQAPYEVICCNILAGPLMAFAPDAARHLAPGGHLLLAGLIDKQAPEVIACHEAEGLRLQDSHASGEWRILHFVKPA